MFLIWRTKKPFYFICCNWRRTCCCVPRYTLQVPLICMYTIMLKINYECILFKWNQPVKMGEKMLWSVWQRVLLRKAMQKPCTSFGSHSYVENNNPTENPKRTTISIKLFNFSFELSPTAKASPLFIFNLKISRTHLVLQQTNMTFESIFCLAKLCTFRQSITTTTTTTRIETSVHSTNWINFKYNQNC